MSRHEGVSCDICMKNNFRGLRYKCLVCYDFDLCAQCFEAGGSGQSHTPDHPMQCIVARGDFDVYYGGENIQYDHTASFTCPFCGRIGFSEITLQEHVASDHADSTREVVCPVCATIPGLDPNQMTEDLAAHLALDHGNHRRENDEPVRAVRAIPTLPPGAGRGFRGGPSARSRARHANLTPASAAAVGGGGSSGAGLASLTSRAEAMDPIAELLSQLGGIRRGGTMTATMSQLQQFQQAVARQGGTRRANQIGTTLNPNDDLSGGQPAGTAILVDATAATVAPVIIEPEDSGSFLIPTLFANLNEPGPDQAERSEFVMDLLMSTMSLPVSELPVGDRSPPISSYSIVSATPETSMIAQRLSNINVSNRSEAGLSAVQRRPAASQSTSITVPQHTASPSSNVRAQVTVHSQVTASANRTAAATASAPSQPARIANGPVIERLNAEDERRAGHSQTSTFS